MGLLEQWTDEQLVSVFGDPGFEGHSAELFRRLNPGVLRVLRRRLRHQHDVEDCVNETWRRVLTGKNTFVPNGAGSVSPWIHTIADRTASDFFRRPSTRPMATTDPAKITERDADDPLPEEDLAGQEEARWAHDAVKSLPAEDQAVFVLARPAEETFGLGRLTQQQVADLMGYHGPAAVYRRLTAVYREIHRLAVGTCLESAHD